MTMVAEFLRFIRWPAAIGVGVSGGVWLGMSAATWPEWVAILVLLVVGVAAHIAIFVVARDLQRARRGNT
jgi:apolipoprotein N-acyltransferase